MAEKSRRPAPRSRFRAGPVFLAIALLLLGARAVLPWAVKRYVNRTLDKIPGYGGVVGDVDIHLWRGAYRIRDVAIVRTSGKVPVPFFSADRVDLSVQWKELVHGALVGEIEIDGPKVNFVKGPTKAESQTAVDESWQDRVRELFPLKLNRVRVRDGQIHYRDFHGKPEVDVYLKDVNGAARNLTNSEKVSKTLMASVDARATPVGGGDVRVHLDYDPFTETPTFDLDAAVENIDLVSLNQLFRHYAGVDVHKGRLDLFSECAAKDGAFKGYVKPLLKDLDVVDLKREDMTLGKAAKEAAVAFVGWFFKNRPKKDVATKVEFSGDFDDPRVDIWGAVAALFKNGFVKGLAPRLDGSVGLEDVGKK